MANAGLLEALHIEGHAGPDAERLALYGQFIGSWDITWAGLGADGRAVTARGELHFGWVLGGRAVQDVWIVPGRGVRGELPAALAFHGSAVRFYDPAIAASQCTWIDPLDEPRAPLHQPGGRRRHRDALRAKTSRSCAGSFTDITKRRVQLARRDLARRRQRPSCPTRRCGSPGASRSGGSAAPSWSATVVSG